MQLSTQLKTESGYQWVVNQLTAQTPFGRARQHKPRWFAPEDSAALQRELDNVARALELQARPHAVLYPLLSTLSGFHDPSGSLNRTADAPMNEVELFEIKYFLLNLRRLIQSYQSLHLPFEGIEFQFPTHLLERLDPSGRGLPAFALENCYHPELETVRGEKAAIERALTKCGEQEREELLERRRRVVVREDELEGEVRAALTAEIVAEKETLTRNMDCIGQLDFLLAKGRLAKRFGCVKPRLSPDASLTVQDMFHPEVAAVLAQSGQSFTPVSLSLRAGATVITGANMGGKSITLKTLTLNILLLQTGFFAFAREFVCPLFHSAALLLADNQSSERGLSSFGGEVMAIQELLQTTNGRFFFLALDEFARGTNPTEGAALARALVEYLSQRPCIALLTTHYDGVADAAAAHYQVAGLRAPADTDGAVSRPDTLAALMDYRLFPAVPGAPCPRDALRVCQLLHLEREIVEIFEKHLTN